MDDLNVFYPMTQETGRLCEGYDQLIIGGYNSLTSKLAEGLNIELNKVITKIEDVVDDKQVKVTCRDGSEYVADFVICSVPLGVLKSKTIEFVPALPENMTSSLDKLAMGGFEKVSYVLFFFDLVNDIYDRYGSLLMWYISLYLSLLYAQGHSCMG